MAQVSAQMSQDHMATAFHLRISKVGVSLQVGTTGLGFGAGEADFDCFVLCLWGVYGRVRDILWVYWGVLGCIGVWRRVYEGIDAGKGDYGME